MTLITSYPTIIKLCGKDESIRQTLGKAANIAVYDYGVTFTFRDATYGTHEVFIPADMLEKATHAFAILTGKLD